MYYKRFKTYLRGCPQIVAAHNSLTRANWWLRDIRSALFSRRTKLVETPYGFRLLGSNLIHHRAMQEGTFEPEETRLFSRFFAESDVFVDVGANIGFFSCLARQAGTHVIAIEPQKKNLDYLYANILANDWKDVEVFPVGLGASPGVATLFGGSSTGASLIGGWAGSSLKFRQIIPISTLDILLGTRYAGKKIFIKMDVEGFEYQALLGSVKTMALEPKPTWVVEICLNEFYPDGINPDFQNTFNLFWQHGYEARTADQRERVIQQQDVERWVKCGNCDSGTINYKFVPKT